MIKERNKRGSSRGLILYDKVLSELLPGTTAWFKMPLVETDLAMGLDGERRDASGPITPLCHETGCSYIHS